MFKSIYISVWIIISVSGYIQYSYQTLHQFAGQSHSVFRSSLYSTWNIWWMYENKYTYYLKEQLWIVETSCKYSIDTLSFN